MSEKSRSRKQKLVQEAIHNAAMTLFVAKGFDETTIEEVAQTAGVSRRSFFRYFASKDDLLAQSVVDYGAMLTESVRGCPMSLTPYQVVQVTALAGLRYSTDQPETRQIIAISAKSQAAQQAHGSRLREVEKRVAMAYAERLGFSDPNDLLPYLLASLTLAVLHASLIAWFRGDCSEVSVATNQALKVLRDMVLEDVAPQKRARPAR